MQRQKAISSRQSMTRLLPAADCLLATASSPQRVKIGLVRGRERADELLHQREPHGVALLLTHIVIDHALLSRRGLAGLDGVEQALVESRDILDVGVLL